jgi:hypothetical protein
MGGISGQLEFEFGGSEGRSFVFFLLPSSFCLELVLSAQGQTNRTGNRDNPAEHGT